MKKIISFLIITAICFPLVACTAPQLMSSESFAVDSADFTYFYVKCMQNTLASYSDAELSELGFDRSRPTKGQTMPNGDDWQDFFKEKTVDYISELLVLCNAANEAGIKITAEDGLDEKLARFKAECEKRYSVSFEEYLDSTYGGAVDEQSFKHCLSLEMLANKYLESVNGEFYDISDAQIAEYISKNIETPDNTATRSLYAVLLTGDGAENRADELLSKLGENDFSTLAKEFSESDEILYENCKKGDMIGEIDAWLYAEGRAVGDVGTVRSGKALYILCYFEDGLTVSELEARYAIAKAAYDAHLNELYEQFPIQISDKNISQTLLP